MGRPTTEVQPEDRRKRPLVFISHDHRDADLAEAFGNLLTDASGGFLKSFRSSDRRGTSGIEFGAEWYTTVMSRLDEATDVVALLTQNSMDRPWILYEAGVAKGKLGNTVFGVAVNIPLEQASRGPFAQFQNSDDGEDSLTKLVLQLIQGNSDAEPREEAVRRQVSAFRDSVARLRITPGEQPEPQPEVDAGAVAKLFEEIKVMLKDLPDRLQKQVRETLVAAPSRKRRKLPLATYDSMLYHAAITGNMQEFATAWMMALSAIREDVYALYEVGMDVYRALVLGNPHRIRVAVKQFGKALLFVDPGMLRETITDGRSPDEFYYMLRQFHEHLQHFVHQNAEITRAAPKGAEGSANLVQEAP
jgi:hypothetical protein